MAEPAHSGKDIYVEHMSKIAISMGCPVGIGPEIILKYFATSAPDQTCNMVVIGDLGVLEHCAATLEIPARLKPWRPGQELVAGEIPVLETSRLTPEDLVWGRPTIKTGQAMATAIEQAVHFIKEGVFSALVTCPISKAALHDAGYHFPGHTEMLAHLSHSSQPVMMMAGSRLRVTLATIHCALAEVPTLLTSRGIVDLIMITHASLQQDFGIHQPRIAVAGLNPHGGESGLFGHEEDEIILPAVRLAQAAGITISGPFPPDTVFHRAAGGAFDAVVCMYHDQGLIPFKLLHFSDGVNVTLGLPFIRTSVDHGTAYDIAGQGKAATSSLAAAIELAIRMEYNRRNFNPTP